MNQQERRSAQPTTTRADLPLVLDAAEVSGVLFDLDGVLTDTAVVHAASWARVFDEFFAEQRQRSEATLTPFEIDRDYYELLDGRLRQDGVAAVLASREIELPFGVPSDQPTDLTVWGVANRKQVAFTQELRARGARPLAGAVGLVRRLRRKGIRCGVVSSSRNALAVLRAAGLDHFDIVVDGVDSLALGLAGKPDPAAFLEAATRIGADASRVAVFEDAVAGVEAARAGGFAWVLGIGDGAEATRLAAAGATRCIADLSAVDVVDAPAFLSGIAGGDLGRHVVTPWVFEFDATDGLDEARREALCTLGNGLWATRGAPPEAVAGPAHYPGTYAAGVYNRLVSSVHGHELEHEDLVNLPNWLPVTFRVAGGDWFGGPGWVHAEDRYRLDLRSGSLVRRVRATDPSGHTFVVQQRRLTSMGRVHVAALETEITLAGEQAAKPLHVEVRTSVDARVSNAGVRAYRSLDGHHLHRFSTEVGAGADVVRAETVQSRIQIGMAARVALVSDTAIPAQPQTGAGWVARRFDVTLEPGRSLAIEKTAALYTSRDNAIAEPGLAAATAVAASPSFQALIEEQRAAWERLWARAAMSIDADGRTPAVVNLHIFHLLQSVSAVPCLDLDAGVTARGLTGEAYRGHVFWDELFILPYLTVRFPDVARSLLLYRHRRLDKARALARNTGHAGAMFPWQSGSDGQEETPVRLYNVRSGRWMPDNSQRQRHVSLAIAHNVWRYVQVTGDHAFLVRYGTEMLVEIARFWADIATFDPERDRYDISGVMGPDEFHDGYPDRPGEGLVNNTYTNVMASWVLCRAIDAVRRLGSEGGDLWERLDLHPEELEVWEEVSRRLTVEFDRAGRLAQFRGYDDLQEFDWDRYRDTYDNIGRLDLILEAEGDTTNRYQLSKQADVLMLFYLFSAEEVTAQLDHLGYRFDPACIPDTVRHYLARTSHGSTLCRVAHSWVLARTDRPQSWQLFLDALASDIDDSQGGTTGEGVHLGAMAGTVDLLQRCYSGMEITEGGLRLNPQLPSELRRLRFHVLVRGHPIDIDIDHRRILVRSRGTACPPVPIALPGRDLLLEAGAAAVAPLKVPRPVAPDASDQRDGRPLRL